VGFAIYCEQAAHGTSVYHGWGIPMVPGHEQCAARLTPDETLRRLAALIRATPVAVARAPGSPDETLHLRAGRALDAACQREVRHDEAGFTLFGYLAWRNPIGLHSGIVFARDLYERNDELFARYPGWAIWRWAPPPGEPNVRPALTRLR